MSRVYNFSAGPAALPLEVLETIRQDIPDWLGTGMSVMEVSHRGKDFVALAARAEANLRSLLQVQASLGPNGINQFLSTVLGLLVNEKINQQLFGAARGKSIHPALAHLQLQLAKDAHLKLRHRPIISSLVPVRLSTCPAG